MKTLRVMRKYLPWWTRIGAKIILARLPFGYQFWKRLGLFAHGDMNQPATALAIFSEHLSTADLSNKLLPNDFTLLELGPGDSLFTALIGNSMGAKKIWLIDAGAFALTDIGAYRLMAKHLESLGFVRPIILDSAKNLGEVLAACNSEYLTDGVSSLAKIPDRSVDYCFSNAVLEHIPLQDFKALAAELHRVLKPKGICVHRVDLQDHLGGALNNLRFSESTWEGPLFSRSGFYTNRIRFSTMINLFQSAGFKCEVPRKLLWDSLPTPRSALAEPFYSMSTDELSIYGFDVVLRHKSTALDPTTGQNPTESQRVS